MKHLFFTPQDGVAADFIPYYKNGTFHLFYLHDYRNAAQHGEGVPWYLLNTQDFVQFEQPFEVLPRGGAMDQDLFVFTGSVIEKDGLYHIFYTGHNPRLEEGGCVQGVMHAVSKDMRTWEKLPEDTFFSDFTIYEKHDWRDPFVFYNEEAGEYWMLLAARRLTQASRRRGCTALCASKDLKHWDIRDDFFAPSLYYTHECPDVFKMGDWWYLIFSEFSDDTKTRYRMAKSPKGPWLKPAVDSFDARSYYAAKSAEGNGKRYLFGWLSTRSGHTDQGGWEWGGTLVVHELRQNADGTLYPCIPETIDTRPGKTAYALAAPHTLHAADKGYDALLLKNLPDVCRIDVTFKTKGNTGEFGVLLHSDEAQDNQYMVRVDQDASLLRMDAFPRHGDASHMALLSRSVELNGNEHHLTLLIDGTACVAYLDGQAALSGRMYQTENTCWGVYAQEAEVDITHLSLTDYAEE